VSEHVRILALDVGTGTQDILLYDSGESIENCFQLIMPSPTVIAQRRILLATAAGAPVLLTGDIMGGGPCAWAARDHAQAGFPCYTTASAARTLDDDLAQVAALGLRIIGDDEVASIRAREGAALVEVPMGDFDSAALRNAFGAFGVDARVDAVAVAVFDHGAAPPGISDRRFRFDAISTRVRQRPDALAFAWRGADVPADLTRLVAVASAAVRYPASDGRAAPTVIVMDTGAAALAGALEDPIISDRDEALVTNLGNFHTLAFHLRGGRISGLFEHHTGELDRPRLEGYLRDLAHGDLDNERIFADSGHGALILDTPEPRSDGEIPFLAVTGPRREMLRGSALKPYEPAPHGDMMLAGCFGLLRAVAEYEPDFAPAIEISLGPAR
jgi:uncharacterized protein (DUF1786 family)